MSTIYLLKLPSWRCALCSIIFQHLGLDILWGQVSFRAQQFLWILSAHKQSFWVWLLGNGHRVAGFPPAPHLAPANRALGEILFVACKLKRSVPEQTLKSCVSLSIFKLIFSFYWRNSDIQCCVCCRYRESFFVIHIEIYMHVWLLFSYILLESW